MLLENVGHYVLHETMHLADSKAPVASALAFRLSLSSCPGFPKPTSPRMLCVSLRTEQVGAKCTVRVLTE